MLHVHGGSIVLDHLRAAGIPGAFLEWCDVVCQGPLPAAVTPAEWLDVRGRFLEDAYGQGGIGARERLAAQDAALSSGLTEHDEVVFWSSADWFCQAILVCLLARLDAGELGAARRASVALVCLGEHPDTTERGCVLAFLSPGQLHEQLSARVPVTSGHTRLARRAWDALRAPDPGMIATLAREPMVELPYAREGVVRHLRELPHVGSGISLTEQHVLEAVAEGSRTAIDLFPTVAAREDRPWITDTMFAHVLRDLAGGPAPLVTLDPDALPPTTDEGLRRTRATITAVGRDVLAGRSDWIALAGIDRWVGGVHLTGDRVWRWDEAERTVRAP